MTQAGEQWWRLHVELQAHPAEQTAQHAERMAALWEILPDRDRTDIRRRLAVASGDIG